MYELIFAKRATKEFKRLESEIKERIWKKLQECKEDPFRFFEYLSEIGTFKLRIGDYRVLADIDKSSKKININKVGHRRSVYER
jgi:mRNA interferase RelE/StbE